MSDRQHVTLPQRVWSAISSAGLLRAGDRVAAAVSGGADSVALLLLLAELAPRLGIRLSVCHFNHQLRGPASDADEEFVRKLAASLKLDCVLGREDVAGRARREGWNIEDTARRLRYAFFRRLVDGGQADRVAVAHSADDQAETVLAHLLRGTGPTGLGGIYPQMDCVVRPLLDVRREELKNYLRDHRQGWREDESNLDQSRLRARIRHRLLPILENEFQPAVVGHLGRLANLAREEERFWSHALEARIDALVKKTADGLSIRVADLLEPFPFAARRTADSPAHPGRAATRRLIRRLLTEVHGSQKRLTSQHVQGVIQLAESGRGGQRLELPGGMHVERIFDRILFPVGNDAPAAAGVADETERRAAAYQYRVELGEGRAACIFVPEIRRRFRLKVVDWPLPASDTRASAWAAALDADRIRLPLVLRNWRPGDSYRPLGRKSVRKLKRLLLEERVATRDRAGWPVLVSGGVLAWARGLPVAADLAPRHGTRSGLVIAEDEF